MDFIRRARNLCPAVRLANISAYIIYSPIKSQEPLQNSFSPRVSIPANCIDAKPGKLLL
jgi:hypothetical protein